MSGFFVDVGEAADATQQFANGFQDMKSNPVDGVVSLSQVATALINLVASNPLLGQVIGSSLSIFSLEREYQKLTDELRKPMAELDYQKISESMVGLIGGVGGVMAAMPFPHVKAAGVAITLSAAAIKEYQSGNILNFLNDVSQRLDAINWEGIKKEANDFFNAARGWTPPRDPLVLDLDGHGIHAIGIDPAHPILFDHDGDGTKNATGWIGPDDGFVVLDRNGNGAIDSGRELFGDQTLKPDTGDGQAHTYANGYEALAAEDANGDGVIDAHDAVYAQLRIWQDTNQDGISQAGELHTLADLGIASIDVAGKASKVDLGHGNTQPWSGRFTRTDGSQGTSGVALN